MNSFSWYRNAVIIILALSFYFPAKPIDSPSEQRELLRELSLKDLLEFELSSGSFLQLDIKKSPVSMTIITAEMIEMSGARNMSELLEIYVPGFQYMYNKWDGTLWGMRGVSNDRNTKIIYMINGHKMNTQARDGFQGEVVLGLMRDIERIEVLRGPAGVIYGSGAIAGIINVVTRKTGDNAVEISSSVISNGSKQVEASVYGSPNDKMNLAFSAGFRSSTGFDRGRVRLYGKQCWPFPSALEPDYYKNGVPSDGNYGSTDGNWKTTFDLKYHNFNLYFRATRQKESAGGLFIYDPWPDFDNTVMQESTVLPDRVVEGRDISSDDPFWVATESQGENLRRYISDNIMAEASYDIALGKNNLNLKGSIDRNTTRIDAEERAGYSSRATASTGSVFETFGEMRLSFSTTYHLRSLKNLQYAAGIEYRMDRIGDDIHGKNDKNGNPLQKVVTQIDYSTTSLFTEGYYDIGRVFSFDLGGRLDFHTRAFMANVKAALIAHPWESHAIKLIYQTSSNNGSADNYEYNRNHFDPQTGGLRTEPGFERPYIPPIGTSDVIPPAPPKCDLHSLRPERVRSLELTSTHVLGNTFTISPSFAVGQVSDLFAWSQDLYRVVNAGRYNYANGELTVQFDSRYFKFGGSHTVQRPIFTDVNKQGKTIGTHYTYSYDSVQNEFGKWMYYPVITDSAEGEINIVRDGITSDGKNFLNLSTNITKLYLTVYPFPFMALHSNLRLFWGLAGRKNLYEQDENSAYQYLNLQNGGKNGLKGIPKKLNVSVHFFLQHDINLSLFAYDILGRDRSSISGTTDPMAINAIRWQQMATPYQKDLASTDLRCFGFTVTKGF